MQGKKNRILKVALTILVLVTAFRLALPFIVTRHVNNILNQLEGYNGSIGNVNIQLLRGAYQIENLKVFKDQGSEEIPFIDIPLTDFSIEWNAVLHGALAGEVRFKKPILHFIAENKIAKDTTTRLSTQPEKKVNWPDQIKRLMPLKINRLTVNNGEITFSDFSTNPQVNLFLHNVQLDATNLSNTKDNPEELPSRVYFQALSAGNGQLNIAMKINVLKEVPDLDMDLRLENVNLSELNNFFKAYAKADVERGGFNLYAEVEVHDGQISGYVKPLFNEIQVANWSNDQAQPTTMVWQSMVDFLTQTFKNQRKDQFATRVSMEGEITQVDTPFWPALWNVFSNSFVKAFESTASNTVSLASASPMANNTAIAEEKKSKRELRKERRKEKREQKRKLKKERKEKEEMEKADKKETKDNS
ncbi:DUF748 domain-containing protein [Chryseosolibacter indicus]|uniref:DUF748 domain-containing protein n=1 Tax=Chryseosolibacter indicus TaxID=2782351 RepID=A0ABS5VLT7_9BACT|nr:DUF748 domain-containing protein [Chryseosolibacter indicus]MBT1702414.1 DUF748 domain-containing protein [Chryseosolibacter indicus]